MSELGNEGFTNDSTALYIHSETSNQRMGNSIKGYLSVVFIWQFDPRDTF